MNKNTFSILILLAIVMTIFSCKEDKDAAEVNSERLIGSNWSVASFSATGCTDSDDNGAFVAGDDGICGEEFGFRICAESDFDFRANGTVTTTTVTTTTVILLPTTPDVETSTDEGTWEILDATRMTLCFDDENDMEDCNTGTYTITGNLWTFILVDDESGCTITTTAEAS